MNYILQALLPTVSVLVIATASACQHQQNLFTKETIKQSVNHKIHPTKVAPQTKVIEQTKILPTKLHKLRHQEIQFNFVTFDSRKQQLIIADQLKGPGSVWKDSLSAAKSYQGIAAINAGFFTPEGKPLGMVISNGSQRGSNNSSSLGSGIFYQDKAEAKIIRRAGWKTLSKSPPPQLLQSGPMLLEHSKTIKGLSSQSSRVRSFIATDGKHHWCIGHASSCTLEQLSSALSSLDISDFEITTALNLDGGRSSDFWVSPAVTGGPVTIRPFWNKPVRNFLILKNK